MSGHRRAVQSAGDLYAWAYLDGSFGKIGTRLYNTAFAAGW